jgi:dTDP-glucose 4,6-dehydratase
MKKIVYVTGCLGFIGYHVTKACLERGWYVYGIDSVTYAANFNLLEDLRQYNDRFKFEVKDINDLTKLYDCDYVINIAAETHVDNSIENSDIFLKSNVNGVHKLLELIKAKPKSRRPILFHFSTDEVYGDTRTGYFKETDLLKPSNPYAATKAAADMLILAWARTYGIPYVIVRPTNNYGIGQYVEKFIPKAVKNLSLGKKIVMHDNGMPRRTWLHVSDTVSAVMTIIDCNIVDSIFNIAGHGGEKQNIDVAQAILKHFYKNQPYTSEDNFDFSEVRPGQDVRYAIDGSKIENLGWKVKANFNTELEKIVNWYKDNFIW